MKDSADSVAAAAVALVVLRVCSLLTKGNIVGMEDAFLASNFVEFEEDIVKGRGAYIYVCMCVCMYEMHDLGRGERWVSLTFLMRYCSTRLSAVGVQKFAGREMGNQIFDWKWNQVKWEKVKKA